MKSKAQLVEKLAESRAYLSQVVEQVGDRWEQPVYDEGLRWNVHELLMHIVDADRGHNLQVMNIAEGKEVIPADFDVERYNKRATEKAAAKTVEEALAELDTNRAALLVWLESVDDEKLDREGRHASGTSMTVRNILRTQALHTERHAQDIARALGMEA